MGVLGVLVARLGGGPGPIVPLILISILLVIGRRFCGRLVGAGGFGCCLRSSVDSGSDGSGLIGRSGSVAGAIGHRDVSLVSR